jgi:hypothetical protein
MRDSPLHTSPFTGAYSGTEDAETLKDMGIWDAGEQSGFSLCVHLGCKNWVAERSGRTAIGLGAHSVT